MLSFMLHKIISFFKNSKLPQWQGIVTRGCEDAPKKTKKSHNFSFSYGLGMTWGWRLNWRWIIPLINCCHSMSRINLKSLNWRAVQHIFTPEVCLSLLYLHGPKSLLSALYAFRRNGAWKYQSVRSKLLKREDACMKSISAALYFDDIEFVAWACNASLH